jgi:hypothetical protein
VVVVVEVGVERVRGVVVWVGVEVEEVEVKGSAVAVLGAGVGVAVEEMGWAGHSWGLQEGAACTAQQQPGCRRICLVRVRILGRDTQPQPQILHTTWRPPCSHPLQIAARRMREVEAWCPGELRHLTILGPRPGGPFCLALSALSDTVAFAGKLGFGNLSR